MTAALGPVTTVPVLETRNVAKHYTLARGPFSRTTVVKALDGVSLSLEQGRTLAVVGESGCGKSTLARLVAMIEPPTSGELFIEGEPIVGADRATLKRLRSHVQIVFQDPYSSLSPRQKIGSILEEPLLLNRRGMTARERQGAAFDMMAHVGLRPEHYDRYPHMFSGGQRQRISIARALMLNPQVLVLDEPVSALDLSVQAQVLNILADLQERFGLGYLFISHALSVVRHIADEVMVMYLGRTVERGSRDAIFAAPSHPYTRALLSATPVADPTHEKQRMPVLGEPPSPIDPPPGCAFHPRCPLAFDRCRVERPELEAKGRTAVACWAVG